MTDLDLTLIVSKNPAFFKLYLGLSEDDKSEDLDYLSTKVLKKINDKISTLKNEQECFVFCLASDPRLDFYIKLFQLQDSFSRIVSVPLYPLIDQLDAERYIKHYFNWLKDQARQVDLNNFGDIVKDRIKNYAAHFSGKLINSEISSEASVFCSNPLGVGNYVYSRAIFAAGYNIPLDQTKLDNEGLFQRIFKVLTNDEIVSKAELPEFIKQFIINIAKDFFDKAEPNKTVILDKRLRQLLLPSGNSYLAISPLASGGLNALFDEAVSRIEEIPAEQNEAESENPETAHTHTKQKSNRKRMYTRLNFPLGGAIVRNVSIYSAKIIQNPLFFEVPTRKIDISLAWSFVFNSVRLRLSSSETKAYQQYIERLPESIRNSSATTAIIVEKTSPLKNIIIKQHEVLSELANTLHETPFQDESGPRTINLDLLKETRKNPITDLDLAIVNGSFNSEYIKALATEISAQLNTAIRLGPNKVPLTKIDRDRIVSAGESILENFI